MRKAMVLFYGVLAMAVLLLVSGTAPGTAGAETAGVSAAVSFGKIFWKQWGDGNAELASYDLTLPRYGQARQGVAVSIVIPDRWVGSPRCAVPRILSPSLTPRWVSNSWRL